MMKEDATLFFGHRLSLLTTRLPFQSATFVGGYSKMPSSLAIMNAHQTLNKRAELRN